MKINKVKSVYLKGKEARFLDNRVTKALKEHKEKKTVRINSLADLI